MGREFVEYDSIILRKKYRLRLGISTWLQTHRRSCKLLYQNGEVLRLGRFCLLKATFSCKYSAITVISIPVCTNINNFYQLYWLLLIRLIQMCYNIDSWTCYLNKRFWQRKFLKRKIKGLPLITRDWAETLQKNAFYFLLTWVWVKFINKLLTPAFAYLKLLRLQDNFLILRFTKVTSWKLTTLDLACI